MTGIWHIDGISSKCFAKLSADSSVAHNNPFPAIYYLTVPAGVDKFSVIAACTTDFGLWVIDPAGKAAGFINGVNNKHLKNAPKRYARHFKITKSAKPQRFQIILWNPAHLYLKINGFEPMISVVPAIYNP